MYSRRFSEQVPVLPQVRRRSPDLRDEEGRLTGFISVISDVTERARAEEALKKSEARLAQAQRVAHVGSWELDLLENRLSWSDEIYRIF